MRKMLISAAALALLAIPALAQPEQPGSRGKAAAAMGQAPAPQAAPAAAPQSRGERGGDRGNRAPAAAPAAAPAPQAGPQQNRGGNSFSDPMFRSGNTNAVPENRGGRQDNNSGRRDDRRGDDRFGNGNRYDNRGNNFGNRPGNNGYGNRPGYGGQRNDYSNFRYYHRGFNAERRFRAPSYRRPQGWYARRWSFGEILPSLFWGQQYWLSDFQDYDLPPPPPGTVWVRYGNDAMLIDRYTGEIITVQYSVFY